MTGSASHASLRRKARLARDEHDARSMSVTRALRIAMEKAADEDLGMPLAVQGLHHQMQDHASLLDLTAQDRLLVLLDGSQGARGAAMLDTALVASLIEAQTMGQVQTRPVAARPLTRTDAAMAAPLVDCMLTRLADQLAGHPDALWVSGFRFGVMMDDRRSLGLALGAPDYHVFQIEVDIGPGTRRGELLLALPQEEKTTLPGDDPAQMKAMQAFQARILEASVRLDAVLCRMSLPLERISQLRAGDLLPLPKEALHAITLEGPGRQTVATAQLGRLDGMRALRLTFASPEDAQTGMATPTTQFTPLMDAEEETQEMDMAMSFAPQSGPMDLPDIEDEDGVLDAADLDKMLFDLDLASENDDAALQSGFGALDFGTDPAAA